MYLEIISKFRITNFTVPMQFYIPLSMMRIPFASHSCQYLGV